MRAREAHFPTATSQPLNCSPFRYHLHRNCTRIALKATERTQKGRSPALPLRLALKKKEEERQPDYCFTLKSCNEYHRLPQVSVMWLSFSSDCALENGHVIIDALFVASFFFFFSPAQGQNRILFWKWTVLFSVEDIALSRPSRPCLGATVW